MKSISVSDYLHKWIMDHKDSEHKSADEVILGVISQNGELIRTVDSLLERINETKKIRKYPAPCGKSSEPGHENHNCKICANNKDGCPENCHYWQCYAGYECHFKPE